ncbi:hypothetical protein JOC85_003556 [Bacillus mesophilus]|uniref:YolD-like family protein n=1 Tax=Bacillus mesophilus TaxID=1808955 RepID=A0A6M0QA00_9BACI|nr:hypothetical protein [Bacillus mesophilus]MBM7662746.1 hypothetical protein [Bacillus mesophilus]NEY73194.1 hypothetical protein [Bacillus mesophilus]
MESWEKNFNAWQKSNELIYVEMMKQKKGRTRVYGRLLSFDMNEGYVQIYNDDEKSVHKLSFGEIDHISSTKH